MDTSSRFPILNEHDITIEEFSHFIVYVDESGDHSLTSIDRQFPLFLLNFCIFIKEKIYQRYSASNTRF